MFKTLLTKALLAFACTSILSATASANIILDLDLAEGDQGLTSKQVQPGDVVEIELIAQQGAQDIAGFEIVLQFDNQALKFSGYQQGGLMASAISLPASETQTGTKISAGFLGGKSAHDSGSLGKLVFEVLQDPGVGSAIMLVQGSFGADGRTEQFELNSTVTLFSEQAQQGSGFQNQDPMGNMGNQGGMPPQDPMHMGPQDGMNPPNPLQMIQSLPAQLRPAYLETHRLHLQNRLTELNGIRQTLELTQQYLFNANAQERQVIGRVLHNFYRDMHKPDPNQAPTPPPTDINNLLNMMFQSVDQDIQHVTQELQNIPQ